MAITKNDLRRFIENIPYLVTLLGISLLAALVYSFFFNPLFGAVVGCVVFVFMLKMGAGGIV